MTRPRFTVRRLMILAALVAMVLGGMAEVERRRARFLGVARQHWLAVRSWPPPGDLETPWHRIMHEKYTRAARHPWLPVGPDPSSP